MTNLDLEVCEGNVAEVDRLAANTGGRSINQSLNRIKYFEIQSGF